jgi:hypothetical protein
VHLTREGQTVHAEPEGGRDLFPVPPDRIEVVPHGHRQVQRVERRVADPTPPVRERDQEAGRSGGSVLQRMDVAVTALGQLRIDLHGSQYG